MWGTRNSYEYLLNLADCLLCKLCKCTDPHREAFRACVESFGHESANLPVV